MLLNLKFITSPPQISERVAGVAEAFGIGVDSTREFTIFNRLPLKYNDDDLIYVSGDSGSGKSCFLKLFANHERKRNRNVVDFAQINPNPDEILIDSVGADLDEASRVLSVVGLSEAFIMLRKYSELSDGQKYRYKLAKLIETDADIFIIDEFGATLDREMAKVLAYAFQKWARNAKKQIVIASTHHDLIQDFNPDIFIYKGFGEQTNINYYNIAQRPISLLEDMQILTATTEDYEALQQFHYLHGKPAFIKFRFKLIWNQKIIGIILYATPFAGSAGRSQVLPQYKGKQNLKKLNAEVVRISRVIIHPKFRGVGLAHQFIRQCNILTNYPVVEVLAAMLKYNPVFEKAGMTPVSFTKPSREQSKIVQFIKAHGFDYQLMFGKTERTKFLNSLSPSDLEILMHLLIENAKTMGGISKRRGEQFMQRIAQGEFDTALKTALPRRLLYLYWVNPNL